ncbi:dethiobiotin synthase [Phenylobacterium sp.]|uniref:dethiobiotin synthase n=1 Tax=Phenylobacterium sp. TaxID=1871053 RepID=UPI0027362377|nr:dethiobiotin synthase [Phenylobacterium sp.]MDP3658575.1 dethiobiotin synthase [Phenylobacterium sp.]
MVSIFVAGSHTDVGKTYAACALIGAARARGMSVDALKPLVSGLDPDDWADSDPGQLLKALGRPLTQATLTAISPWRYRAPLAPPMAAALEGRLVTLAEVAAFCRASLEASTASLTLVEGVGGVMSPVAEDATCLDLIHALGAPAVLVGGAYLGSISHTLTAAAVLVARGIVVRAIVVSEGDDPSAPDFRQTLASLSQFASAPVVAAPRGQTAWAGDVLDLRISGAGAG